MLEYDHKFSIFYLLHFAIKDMHFTLFIDLLNFALLCSKKLCLNLEIHGLQISCDVYK